MKAVTIYLIFVIIQGGISMSWLYLVGLIVLIGLGSWGWVSRAEWLNDQIDNEDKKK